MVKIYQGELPKNINVVVGGKVLTTARFIDGIYESDNKEVIAELKRYGYKVEKVKSATPNKPSTNVKSKGNKPKSNKAKPNKKKVD